MAYTDYSKNFRCPFCGKTGSIYVLKLAKNLMIVKQKCPNHKEIVFKIPLDKKDELIYQIRDNVFRCFVCGEKTTISSMEVKGPWVLLKCSCPTHGVTRVQKIWDSIYRELTSKEVIESEETSSQIKPQLQREPNPLKEMKFCPSCGISLEPMVVYCNSCDSEIE